MKVWVDIVKTKLAEYVWPGLCVALKLCPWAAAVKVTQEEKCRCREAIVVWINVSEPAIPGRKEKKVGAEEEQERGRVKEYLE